MTVSHKPCLALLGQLHAYAYVWFSMPGQQLDNDTASTRWNVLPVLHMAGGSRYNHCIGLQSPRHSKTPPPTFTSIRHSAASVVYSLTMCCCVLPRSCKASTVVP